LAVRKPITGLAMQEPSPIAAATMNADNRDIAVPSAGERRRLTVLFADLVGSTVLGREMESELFSELLVRLREIWHQSVARHGGRVIRTQGDGVLAVFGYPRSGEDDGRRAAEAALDIQEAVSKLRQDGIPSALMPLRMHSGIHAGTLLLAEGDIECGRFDLIGDVVNTAAHMSQQAAPGQILVSLDALGPHANFFELGPDLRETGSGMPRLRAVLGRGTATRRFESTARRGLTPFIGRDEIMSSLVDFLSRPAPADSRCAVVVGGAGLGKTRLLEELLQRCDGGAITLLHGSCESYVGAEVLQPFLQMLRAYFHIRAEMPRDEAAKAVRTHWHPSLTETYGLRVEAIVGLIVGGAEARGSQIAPGDMVGDLLAFLSALSAMAPSVLVIDDWQWADDATRQLLESLLRFPKGPRILLASRPRDDGADWISGAWHLTLAPFQGSETDRAVRRWLPQADPFLIARIHSYAGGVPLFIEELCHSASADHLSAAIEGRGSQGWLATLVASRLARLPADQADVVRAAAVIGNVVPRGLLVSACSKAADQATMQALADADFLYADPAAGGFRFKHGITRDAVYDSIGLHARKALHQGIEIALLAQSEPTDREDALETLAYHCRGAGHWDSAAYYAERAGDKAMAAFAPDRARIQYLVAIDALDRLPEPGREQQMRWCLLVNKLGMASIFDPLSLNSDISKFERAVELARELDDAATLARAKYWLGYMCYGFGRFREGIAHARDAVTVAREANAHRLAAQVEAVLGQILAASCHYDEAIALMDGALSTKQQRSRPTSGIAIGSAYTLSCKASVLADRGDFDSAHACFEEATSLLNGSTHPVANSVRNWMAVSLIWQGRWQEAECHATEGARVAENMRSLLLLADCRAAAGFARWSATGDAVGLQQLRDAVQWMEGRRFQFYISVQFSWLVEACAAEGDIAAARRYAARVLRRAREGERLGEASTCRAMARIAADVEDFSTCERWLRRAEASARFRNSSREIALNQATSGHILKRRGETVAASRLLADAASALRAMGMNWHAEQLARLP